MKKESIGQRLRRLRDAAKLTQEALARAAEVSTSYVSRIEQGVVQDPGLELASRLAAVLAERLGRPPGDVLHELGG